MPKLDYLQQKKLSPADELREILSSLEERQIQVKTMSSEQALNLLRDLDQARTLLQQFESTELDLLPERSRFTMIQARLKKQAPSLLKALGGVTELEKQRPIPAPPQTQWWWYVDELVAAQRRRWLRGVMIGLVIALLLVGGLILLFQTVLAPSPEAVARLEAQDQAEAAIVQGSYAEALNFIEAGLAKVPDDPDLLIYKGVVQELLGDEAIARQSFNQAQTKLNDPLHFYLMRSQLNLRIGRAIEAEGDAQAAIGLDQSSAAAWLLLGQALEIQQKIDDAILAYQKASELANVNNDPQIYVTARLALGRLGGVAPQ
jgi:tetratricopeptide (TPR) repeat protein